MGFFTKSIISCGVIILCIMISCNGQADEANAGRNANTGALVASAGVAIAMSSDHGSPDKQNSGDRCTVIAETDFGSCTAIIGVAYNGKKCISLSGCGCGAVCDSLFDTMNDCQTNCYSCPVETAIDCMPIVQQESNPYCYGDYHDWILANCPNVLFTQ